MTRESRQVGCPRVLGWEWEAARGSQLCTVSPTASPTVGCNVNLRCRDISHCSKSEQLGQKQTGRASGTTWHLRS